MDLKILNRGKTWPRNSNYNKVDNVFLLYSDDNNVTITTSYQECEFSLNCHCSVNIRVDDGGDFVNFAFIDFCGRKLESDDDGNFEFTTWDGESSSGLDCDDQSSNNIFSCIRNSENDYLVS